MIELLSPAGDFECLQSALTFGADAVYIGTADFGLRSGFSGRRQAFSLFNLAEATALAHKAGRQVFLTCNTVPTNEEAERYPAYIAEAAKAGVDAAIVSDMGIFAITKRICPNLPIHISTQAGVMNAAAATALHDMGANRVVLARELSLEDIRRLRDKTPPELELEAFVHGAMCVSFSGRCLLSKYLTGRDANRGACSQPCRLPYEIRPIGGEKSLEIAEYENGSYILNAKDLCMIEHIREMIAAGITSLKIEGRAKSAYYVAAITNAYRGSVDSALRGEPAPQWAAQETEAVSHRPYGRGFYFGEAEQFYEHAQYLRRREVCGIVISADEAAKTLTIEQRGRFTLDDRVEALQSDAPGCAPIEMNVTEIAEESGKVVPATNKAAEIYHIKADKTVKPGSILRKVI
jgi:putative protease